jgi:hypothetical protein
MKKKFKVDLKDWPFRLTLVLALIYKALYFLNERSMPKVEQISFLEIIEISLPFAVSRLWDILIFYFFAFFLLKAIIFVNTRIDYSNRRKARKVFSIQAGLLAGLSCLLLLLFLSYFFGPEIVFLILVSLVLILALGFFSLLRSFSGVFRTIVNFYLYLSFMLLPFFAYILELGMLVGIIGSAAVFTFMVIPTFLVVVIKKIIMRIQK